MPPKEKLARGRGSAFNTDELTFLLTNVEKVIPAGITGWDTIERLHKEQYPARNSEALKRKFEALHKSDVPADENNVMYTHIIRAKAARNLIVDALRAEEVNGSIKIKEAGDGTERKLVKKDVSSDVNADSKAEFKKQNKSLADDGKKTEANEKHSSNNVKKKEGARPFQNDEIKCLLQLVAGALPVRLNDWDAIHNAYRQSYGYRTREALKRKFTSLLRTPVPEGASNPNCVVARQLNDKIKEKRMKNTIEKAASEKARKHNAVAAKTNASSKLYKGARKKDNKKDQDKENDGDDDMVDNGKETQEENEEEEGEDDEDDDEDDKEHDDEDDDEDDKEHDDEEEVGDDEDDDEDDDKDEDDDDEDDEDEDDDEDDDEDEDDDDEDDDDEDDEDEDDEDEEKKWKRVAKTSQKVRRAQDYEVRRTGRKFGLVRKKKTAEVQQMKNEHVLLLKQQTHKLLQHKRKLEKEIGSVKAKKIKVGKVIGIKKQKEEKLAMVLGELVDIHKLLLKERKIEKRVRKMELKIQSECMLSFMNWMQAMLERNETKRK